MDKYLYTVENITFDVIMTLIFAEMIGLLFIQCYSTVRAYYNRKFCKGMKEHVYVPDLTIGPSMKDVEKD